MWAAKPIRRFFKAPKGVLTLVLSLLTVTATPVEGGLAVARPLAAAILAAGALDTLLRRWKFKVWEYPSGAVLSAALVVMVLRVQERWYIAVAASILAVASKYVFRSRRANVFNPAVLGLLAVGSLFHTGQSWWGAQTDVVAWLDRYRANAAAFLLLIGSGIYVTNRINKVPLAFTFLGTYFLLFTLTAYSVDTVAALNGVAEIFHGPDYEAALFFAFFMLTDPPTSPPRYRDQIVCGVLVAGVAFVCFEYTHAVYYLLVGAVAGNLWEAWRRTRVRLLSTAISHR